MLRFLADAHAVNQRYEEGEKPENKDNDADVPASKKDV